MTSDSHIGLVHPYSIRMPLLCSLCIIKPAGAAPLFSVNYRRIIMASSQESALDLLQTSLEDENFLMSLPSELLFEIVNLLDRKSIKQLMLTNKELAFKLNEVFWSHLFKKYFPMVEKAEDETYIKAFYLSYKNVFNQLSEIKTQDMFPPGAFPRIRKDEVDEEKSRQIMQMFNSGTVSRGLFVDKEFIDDAHNYFGRSFLAIISNSSPEIGAFLNEYYWQPLYEKCFPSGELAQDETYASAFMRSYRLIIDELEQMSGYNHYTPPVAETSYIDLIKSGKISEGLLGDKEFMMIFIDYDSDGFNYASEQLQKDLDLVQKTIFNRRGMLPLNDIAKIFKGDVVMESALKNIEKDHKDWLSTGSSFPQPCPPFSGWVEKYFPPVAQPSARVETPQSLSGAAGKQEVEAVEGSDNREYSFATSNVGMFGATAARADDQGGPCPKAVVVREPDDAGSSTAPAQSPFGSQ